MRPVAVRRVAAWRVAVRPVAVRRAAVRPVAVQRPVAVRPMVVARILPNRPKNLLGGSGIPLPHRIDRVPNRLRLVPHSRGVSVPISSPSRPSDPAPKPSATAHEEQDDEKKFAALKQFVLVRLLSANPDDLFYEMSRWDCIGEELDRPGFFSSLDSHQLANIRHPVTAATFGRGLELGHTERFMRYAFERLRADKEVGQAAVPMTKYARILEVVPARFRADEGIVLAAVGATGGEALGYAAQELQSKRAFVLEAVARDGRALKYAQPGFQADAGIVLEAVAQDASALLGADKELQSLPKFLLEAIARNGKALKYTGLPFREDREFVLAAVAKNGVALMFVGGELSTNYEFLLEAVARNGEALRYTRPVFREERGFVLAAVAENGLALEYAPQAFRDDEGIVLAAVVENGRALMYAGGELRAREEFVLEAVAKNGEAVRYALPHFQVMIAAKAECRGVELLRGACGWAWGAANNGEGVDI